jgi:nucleoside-diphosphate-sugar epimerase
LDAGEIRSLLSRVQPSHLLHFAWYAEHGKFWQSSLNLDWVSASLTLFRAFHENGGKRAVCAGTCAEYEWNESVLTEDSTPLRPATLYGTCKSSLREILFQFAKQEGLSLAWGRIFFLYGPFEAPNRLVSSVILSLLRGVPAELTHGKQIRDFMHTCDVGAAFAAVLDSSFEGALNVASGRGVSLAEVAVLIGELTGHSDLIRLGVKKAPELDPPSLVAHASRLKQTVGFSERYNLRSGLTDTIEWWRKKLEGQP